MEDNGDNKNLLHSDNTHNYYSVTVKSHKGERNLTYGIYDGENISPHKDYIFLFPEKKEIEVSKTDTGLLAIENFEETREEKGLKMKELKNEVNELTKTKVSADLTNEIERKQSEMNRLSKEVNRKQVSIYHVAYVSRYTSSKFSKQFTHVGLLNLSCNTHVLFNGKDYIVASTKYLRCAK